MPPTAIKWICPTCGDVTYVQVWPFIPAKLTGPPETCHEAEGGDYEPDLCIHCVQPIPDYEAHDAAWDVEQELADGAAEAKIQARRDCD